MSAGLRLLILNRCYPPEAGATGKVTSDLAKALSMRHHVTLVVGRPTSNADPCHPYFLLRRQTKGSLVVERLGSTGFHHRRMVGRLANYLTYLALALLRGVILRPRPDVIITMTDPPLTCLPGALIAMVRRCRLVYNVRDLHPDMALAAGIVSSGFFVSLWERLHRWALGRSDLIIVLGEDMRDRVVAKGIAPGKVAVVRDGSEPLSRPSAADHEIFSEIRAGFPFVVVHAGNLGFAGAWETILQAARRLTHEKIRFVFVGDGNLRAELEGQANGLPNVSFMSFRPQQDLPYVLSAGDLQVVTLRHGMEGLVVPSKLYPILMVGCPVLAVTPEGSDTAKIVREHKCGLIADPKDPEAVIQAVVYARDHPEELNEMARRASAIGRMFSREILEEEFIRTIERVNMG